MMCALVKISIAKRFAPVKGLTWSVRLSPYNAFAIKLQQFNIAAIRCRHSNVQLTTFSLASSENGLTRSCLDQSNKTTGIRSVNPISRIIRNDLTLLLLEQLCTSVAFQTSRVLIRTITIVLYWTKFFRIIQNN